MQVGLEFFPGLPPEPKPVVCGHSRTEPCLAIRWSCYKLELLNRKILVSMGRKDMERNGYKNAPE